MKLSCSPKGFTNYQSRNPNFDEYFNKSGMKNTFFGIIAFVKKPWLFKEIVKIGNSRLGIRDAMWRVGTLHSG